MESLVETKSSNKVNRKLITCVGFKFLNLQPSCVEKENCVLTLEKEPNNQVNSSAVVLKVDDEKSGYVSNDYLKYVHSLFDGQKQYKLSVSEVFNASVRLVVELQE